MFDHLLESSHRDDSNKWSNIEFGQEIMELASITIHYTHLIWRSVLQTPMEKSIFFRLHNIWFSSLFSVCYSLKHNIHQREVTTT